MKNKTKITLDEESNQAVLALMEKWRRRDLRRYRRLMSEAAAIRDLWNLPHPCEKRKKKKRSP